MRYQIQEASDGFRCYGGARQAFNSRSRECVLAGPAETGKTYAMLWKLHLLAASWPGFQGVIVRKTYKSAISSVIQTYWNKVVDQGSCGVERFGKERPEFFTYPNGSRVWVAGMDNADKVLSSERDLIYVNQLEELTLAQWETLLTRVTGRAGNMSWHQLLGDANPGPPNHWIRQRKSIEFIQSRHVDNPTLYDPVTGAITPRGRETMAILESLTGLRRERLLLGKWVAAEGLVYLDWRDDLHVVDDSPSSFSSITQAADWGFTDPGVLLLIGWDSDGRAWVLNQVMAKGRQVDWWREQACKQSAMALARYGMLANMVVVDPSRADSAAFFDRANGDPHLVEQYGEASEIKTAKAPNAVQGGIDRVQQRLKVAGDGMPRLFILRDSMAFEDPACRDAKIPMGIADEILEYVWSDRKEETPVDGNDHTLDALRYAIAHRDGVGDSRPVPAGVTDVVDQELVQKMIRGDAHSGRRRAGRLVRR